MTLLISLPAFGEACKYDEVEISKMHSEQDSMHNKKQKGRTSQTASKIVFPLQTAVKKTQ